MGERAITLLAMGGAVLAMGMMAWAGSTPGAGKDGQRESTILLRGIPHIQQKPDFCGEACAAMALQGLGHAVSQDDIFDLTGLSPLEARGAYTKELTAALRHLGLLTGPVWFPIPASQAATALEGQWQQLYGLLRKGIPSIVCTRYDDAPGSPEHFRLVLGYDGAKDQVIFHEPAEANGAFRRMDRQRFLRLWPLKYEPQRWLVIRIAMEAGTLSVQPQVGLTNADYAQRIMELRRQAQGFNMVVEPPFIVLGDEAPEVLARRSEHTVRWAVKHLKALYFTQNPGEVMAIWLFKDGESYRRHTRQIFGDEPDTPYGYYSPRHRALIMNIATGGGTLVHEIVHPFVAANFPGCPAWLNEGLGSLYEQSAQRDGAIVGLTNWRLAGLQRGIRAGELPSFPDLMASGDAFYEEDHGYGQARYLCYYLQERGLLVRFYHDFVQKAAQDPTGLMTLKGILGITDMAAFQRHWEAWVLGLRFDG